MKDATRGARVWLITVLGWLIASSGTANGPAFEEVDTDLPGVTSGDLAWGDYDADGRLDLLVSGFSYDPVQNSSETLTRIYRNEGHAEFRDIAAGLARVQQGSLAWGDYDGNGRLDLVVAGYGWDAAQNVSTPITKIYRNDGNDLFTEIDAGLIGFDRPSLAWGDYNRNGRLDLAIAGYAWDPSQNVSGPLTKIYRNEGSGVFTDTQADILGVTGGSLAWGDYNGDGNLDLALAGFAMISAQNVSGPVTKIYRNNGAGIFTDIDAELIGVHKASVAWGDYNQNGRLDLAVAGDAWDLSQNLTGPTTKIYRNDGDDSFTDINAAIIGVSDGSLAWGDYDGDGQLDLAITGQPVWDPSQNRTVPITRVYRNEGADEFVDTEAGLLGLADSSIAWGDYDGDGLLDLAIMGTDSEWLPRVVIYKNVGPMSIIEASLEGGILTLKARGAEAWTPTPEYSSDLLPSPQVWTPFVLFNHEYNGGTNTIWVDLSAQTESNLFIRIVNQQ